AAIITTKLTSARSTMILRPYRSASRPHQGERMAVTPGVIPTQRPLHNAISPTSVTPSCRMKSGRNGITSVKPVKPMKLAAVTAKRLRRQTADGDVAALGVLDAHILQLRVARERLESFI